MSVTIQNKSPKCPICRNPLETIFIKFENQKQEIEDQGYCLKCRKIREVSNFYKKFSFESYEKQDDSDRLDINDHKLIWKNINGIEQYYCSTCDEDLLHSHHHHLI